VTSNDRRTTRRHYLFTPDEDRRVSEMYWYCFAVAAERTGVELYATTLMSTHLHYVIGDPQGRRPEFFALLHRLLALHIKAFRGWTEEVFNKASTGSHELETPEALVQSIAYTIANPVAAGAVRFAKEWPGAITLPEHIGRRVVRVPRPKGFFDPENEAFPDVAEIRVRMPQVLVDAYGSEEEARALIADRVRELERQARDALQAEGRTFVGVRGVLRTKHTKRATSWEDFGSRNPQFAAAGDREASRAAVARIRAFNTDYESALDRWRAGDRDVVFPRGTWWMRVHHNVRCHPPP
jgi:REP element-mobilizing transposase RayT